ncbi:type VI secretion system baseplate subunit TssE [Paraburkholderia adhaesiva]|uniref:type VI secretion system baseplate subunit TssE n=1 Tax=Paraburkholderia adhaesiva TaxID=2883244 RepID=UPI001F295E1F|nr:type VI secretion system baseplate subunit TssE [Paraburkholderia adhaesiva]
MKRSRTQNPTGAAVPRRTDAQLLPTLLDRLRDDATQRQTEAPGEYAVTRTQLRDIVQRDLSFLLNTTSIEEQIDRERYPEAAASTINFGVPPLAGHFTASRRWTGISEMIRRAILDFEPRIIPGTLEIRPLTTIDSEQKTYRDLDFEIHGMIHMEPYPVEFLVQSSLDLETSRLLAHAGRHGA